MQIVIKRNIILFNLRVYLWFWWQRMGMWENISRLANNVSLVSEVWWFLGMSTLRPIGLHHCKCIRLLKNEGSFGIFKCTVHVDSHWIVQRVLYSWLWPTMRGSQSDKFPCRATVSCTWDRRDQPQKRMGGIQRLHVEHWLAGRRNGFANSRQETNIACHWPNFCFERYHSWDRKSSNVVLILDLQT